MREQNRPFPTQPFVEVDVALRRFGGKVGRFRSEEQSWFVGWSREEAAEDGRGVPAGEGGLAGGSEGGEAEGGAERGHVVLMECELELGR